MSSGNFQKAFLNNFTIFITLKENKIILHHLVSEPRLSWIWCFSCANLCFGGLFGLGSSRLFGVQDGVHINFPLHLRLKYLKTLSLDICCLVKWKHEILVLMFPLAESLLRCYHAKIFLQMLKVFLKCS